MKYIHRLLDPDVINELAPRMVVLGKLRVLTRHDFYGSILSHEAVQARRSRPIYHEYAHLPRVHHIYSPSLQPNRPRHTIVSPSRGSKRALRMFKAPEEQRIIRMPATVHVDVASVVVRKGKVHAREAIRDLEVWDERSLRRPIVLLNEILREDLQDCQSELYSPLGSPLYFVGQLEIIFELLRASPGPHRASTATSGISVVGSIREARDPVKLLHRQSSHTAHIYRRICLRGCARESSHG